jgi:hypothetical protein
MVKITATTTAKEMAWKAYCASLKLAVYKINKKTNNPDEFSFTDLGDVFNELNIDGTELRERFENWWSEYFTRAEHKDGFYCEHNVYVDGHRYIKAE